MRQQRITAKVAAIQFCSDTKDLPDIVQEVDQIVNAARGDIALRVFVFSKNLNVTVVFGGSLLMARALQKRIADVV